VFGALLKRVGWEAENVDFLSVHEVNPYSAKYLENTFFDHF
jgi:hypothetical protein